MSGLTGFQTQHVTAQRFRLMASMTAIGGTKRTYLAIAKAAEKATAAGREYRPRGHRAQLWELVYRDMDAVLADWDKRLTRSLGA